MRTTNFYIKGNDKSSISLDNLIFFLSAIIVSIVVIAQMLELTTIVSLLFAVSIVITIGYYMLKLTTYKKINHWLFLSIILGFLAVIETSEITFDYYKQAIIILCVILCYSISHKLNVTDLLKKRVVVVAILTVFLINILFYFGGLKDKLFGRTTAASLNFENPNAAGIWLTCFFVLLLVSLFLVERKLTKVIAILSAISLLPIILATESRNALLACIFMLFALLFVHFFKIKRKKIPNWIIIFITILPILVFIFYMYIFIPNISKFSFLSFLESTSKPLTSRLEIWEIAKNDFYQCFWLGDYEKYNEIGQMHNSLITLYCMFGGLFTFSTCVIFYQNVKKLDLIPQIAMLTIWITGCLETSVFAGVAGLYLMIIIIPNLVKRKQKETSSV